MKYTITIDVNTDMSEDDIKKHLSAVIENMFDVESFSVVGANRYGCYYGLSDGRNPDSCVKDSFNLTCDFDHCYKSKEECPFWRRW